MFYPAKAGSQRTEGLLPEPCVRPVLLVKFFEQVSGDAFIVRFRKTQAEQQAREFRWLPHGYTFCRSMPSSIMASTF